MASRLDVRIEDSDGAGEILRKLTNAVNYAHELRGPAMIWWRGEQYAMIVPPDAGLAWARAQESARLSDIATRAAGLPVPGDPGTDVSPG